MNYVKQFKINGVDTKQVACIELQGVPNAATEGCVGVLGMDMTSPTHEVYRCVAVNGSVYTWELLSAGMSIISATITGEGGENKEFPYSALRVPNKYLIKVGDLILDSEGYLYQVSSIGGESCNTTYCGTHIGGIASGDKDYRLVVDNGKLQLVTESGAVISSIDHLVADNDTLTSDSKGRASVRGIKTITDTTLRLFVGTKAEYEALTDAQKSNLFAIFTDDTAEKVTLDIISTLETRLINGDIKPKYAQFADRAENADSADEAQTAKTADSATSATYVRTMNRPLTINGTNGASVNLIANTIYIFRVSFSTNPEQTYTYTLFVGDKSSGYEYSSSLGVGGGDYDCTFLRYASGYLRLYHSSNGSSSSVGGNTNYSCKYFLVATINE